MKSKDVTLKQDFYFTILDLLKKEKNPSQISRELGISKQRVSYYTTRLKKMGYIQKISNGVWEVKISDLKDASQNQPKQIRGHAFIWKVKIPQQIGKNWKKILINSKIDIKTTKRRIIRAFINKRKVWFGKNNIIVYEPHSFYGENSIESRKYAVISLLETLQIISNKIHINLKKMPFTASREHYGLVRNELAKQLNRKGEKLIIRDDLDGEWLWVDDSESLGELETGGKGITRDRAFLNKQVQSWWNEQKETGFKITPKFLLEILNGHNNQIGQIVQNQEIFDKNISLHQSVLEEIRDAVRELKETMKNERRL